MLSSTFVNNANYAFLFAMKLEKLLVNDKITAYYETNMSLTLQTTKMNFEKHLGFQVFKNHNYNPQVCPSVSPFVLPMLFTPS